MTTYKEHELSDREVRELSHWLWVELDDYSDSNGVYYIPDVEFESITENFLNYLASVQQRHTAAS